jgi:hypothetical protein
MSAATTLSALSSIIHSAALNIESRFASKGLSFPSLDLPFKADGAQGEAEAFLGDPSVVEDATALLEAAVRLIACVKLPQTSVFNAGLSVSTKPLV